jgi:hypothetical protein
LSNSSALCGVCSGGGARERNTEKDRERQSDGESDGEREGGSGVCLHTQLHHLFCAVNVVVVEGGGKEEISYRVKLEGRLRHGGNAFGVFHL